MRKFLLLLAVAGPLVLFPQAASAAVVTVDFESPDIAPGERSQDYSALEAQGVTVGSAFGIIDDLDDDWGISGTSGTQFIGVNGNPSDILRLEFAEPLMGVSIACSLSNFPQSESSTLNLTLSNDETVVHTRAYTMAGVAEWQALFVYGDVAFNTLEVESPDGSPFGCDNLEMETEALPETGVSALVLLGWALALAAAGTGLVRGRLRS